MDISPTSQLPVEGAARAAAKATDNKDYQTFLVMLTAQIRHQDPLNPIDSSDFAVQLATFSSVEQQVRTNDLLQGLRDDLGLSGLANLASWVGMEAEVAAPVAFEGAPITLSIAPEHEADGAQLIVTDAAGREVTREAVPVVAGRVEWAGRGADGVPLAPGLYGFTLQSYRGETLLAATTVPAYSRVTEIRRDGDATTVVLAGGATVEAGAVRGLRPAGG